MQEKGKFKYRRVTYKICRQVFCPTSRSRQESKGFSYRRVTYKGRKYKKPRKPLSPPGLVCHRKEKKRERPRKVVCRHKKGTWKKRKKKDQGRREGGSPEGKVPCALNQEFLFWFTSTWVLRDPSRLKYRLLRDFYTRKPCAKEVPETDYFTQRKQYLKRTTLRTY